MTFERFSHQLVSMSMNLFLQAFPTEDMQAMNQYHSLVEDWVSDEQRCIAATDIGTAWDVLNKLLWGAGFRSDEFLDDVLFNGCKLMDEQTVRQHAGQLATSDFLIRQESGLALSADSIDLVGAAAAANRGFHRSHGCH